MIGKKVYVLVRTSRFARWWRHCSLTGYDTLQSGERQRVWEMSRKMETVRLNWWYPHTTLHGAIT